MNIKKIFIIACAYGIALSVGNIHAADKLIDRGMNPNIKQGGTSPQDKGDRQSESAAPRHKKAKKAAPTDTMKSAPPNAVIDPCKIRDLPECKD